MSDGGIPRDLGDGLTLRWSRAEDTEGIAALTSNVFREAEDEPANAEMAAYTRALMSGDHPLLTAGDFAVVEERATGRIVACSCLLRQTWRFGGVEFSVGRPELVATDPAFRRRGLIRAIFGALHERSDGRGDLAQAITGIPYFYRQFGYEYALDLAAKRYVALSDIPDAPAERPDTVSLRAATEADLSFLSALYERACRHTLVSAAIPAEYWRFQLTTPPVSDAGWRLLVITDAADGDLGFLNLQPFRSRSTFMVRQLEVASGVGMHALALPVLRQLKRIGQTLGTFKPEAPATSVNFRLGREHPWYEALGRRLAPRGRPPYAWYVRIADLPRFVWHIRPVLERRLESSIMAGYSGDLRLDFYRGGLRLVFADGKLTQAGPWQTPAWGPGDDAAFPPLVFTQLLLGYRDLDALRAAYPDVRCQEDKEPLLRALFPAATSIVLPLD
jgi:GNAT superfamily N-acetyltransferase